VENWVSMLINGSRSSLIIVVLLLVGGCASQVNMHDVLSAKTELQSNQGVVVARVVNAGSYPLPFNQLTITPENVNKSDKIKPERLSALSKGRGVMVFASSINAGNYALNSIRAFHSNGDFIYSRFVGADAKFGLFEVKPGQVTDLGTLVYYPKPQGEKYVDLLVRTEEPTPGEVLKTYFPFFQYNEEEVLGWNDDGNTEQRQDLLVSIAQNPIRFNRRYLAPDNTVYLLGPLGVMVKRTVDGEYELDAVDTNLDLRSIVQNTRGDLVVGGEEGVLFYKPVNSDSWVDISIEKELVIQDLLFHQEHYLDVVANSNAHVKVMRADLNAVPITFKELNQYSHKSNWLNSDVEPVAPNVLVNISAKSKKPQYIQNVKLLRNGNNRAIKVTTRGRPEYRFFGSTSSELFNFNPENWRITETQLETEVDYILDAGATKLGIKEGSFWSWTGMPTYWRFDNENNEWQEIATKILRCPDGEIISKEKCAPAKNSQSKIKKEDFTLNTAPWFYNETDALAIVTFTNRSFWSGEVSRDSKIIQTQDGGKTWYDTGYELPKSYCSSVLTEVVDRLILFCAGASSDFYESADQGQHWEHVRLQENF